VARRNGVEVARDQLRTAGARRTLRLSPDRKVIAADGRSLSFVTVDVVDAHGVTVPGADNAISFEVSGGRLVGLDNGRQESAENYKASSRTAFNGKALAIVQSGEAPGPITVTARSPGLAPARVTIWSTGAGGQASAAPEPAAPAQAAAPEPTAPTADASYSGSAATVPAAMLDGNTETGGWSNFYVKAATALLPAISQARPRDWVSLQWAVPQRTATVLAWFTTGPTRALPATLRVTRWNGARFVPVRDLRVDWATASNQPTTIHFDPVRTSELRLEMTSPSPGSTTGFLQIAELQARSE
jgi:beta-galactosidase